MTAAKWNVSGLLVVGSALMFPSLASADQDDVARDKGISLSAWAGGAMDRSVTNVSGGAPLHPTAALVGITAVANVGELAVGAALDGFSGLFGEGRMAIAALGGWQPRDGRLRLQILGEVGAHRFSDVGGSLFAEQMGGPTWLPYGGVRVGTAWTFGERGHVEVGTNLFARYDLGSSTVTTIDSGFLGSPSTRTDYNVGGFMAGLGIQVGVRFQTPRAPSTSLATR
jgi:hypothetical protein